MSDASQIANTFSNPDIAVPEFTKAQWEYITDNNGGAYTNQLNFLTSQIRNKFTDMHNGLFFIPTALSSSDTTRPYFLHGGISSTAPGFSGSIFQNVAGFPGANFAWKVSVLGFIANILFSTDNSYTITTEQQMYHINMIRLLVEHDYVWIEQEGPFIGYFPDKYPNGVDGAQGYNNDSQYFQPVMSNGNTFKSGSANVGATLNATGSITTPYSTGMGAGSTALGNSNLLATPHMPITNNINIYDLAPGFTTGAMLGNNSGTYIAPTAPGSVGAKIPVADNTAGQDWETVSAGAYTTLGSLTKPNPVLNEGFLKRIQVFYQVAQQPLFSTNGSQYFPNQPVMYVGITIPGKLLTDIWMQIKFPMYNIGYNIALTFSQANEPSGLGSGPQYLSASQSTYPPWMTDNQTRVTEVLSSILATTGTPGTAPVVNKNFSGYENEFLYNFDSGHPNVPRGFAGGQGIPTDSTANALSTMLFAFHQPTTAPPVFRIAFGGGYNGISAPRYMYRNVTYSADETEKLVQRIAAGYSQAVNFTTAEVYQPAASIINWSASGTSFTHTITNSVVMPLRVWAMFPQVNQFSRSDVSPMTLIGQITNCNLYINATPYYSNPMQDPIDFYNILKEQFGMNGSVITYPLFRTIYKIYCFDLTRLQDRLSTPTEPVLIQIQATRNDMVLTGLYTDPVAANKSGTGHTVGTVAAGGDYLQTRRYMVSQEKISTASAAQGQGGGMQPYNDLNALATFYAVQPVYIVERQNRVKFTFTSADAKLEVGNLGAL